MFIRYLHSATSSVCQSIEFVMNLRSAERRFTCAREDGLSGNGREWVNATADSPSPSNHRCDTTTNKEFSRGIRQKTVCVATLWRPR